MSFPAIPYLSLPGFMATGGGGSDPNPGDLYFSPADILRYLIVQLGLGTMPVANGDWPVYCDSEGSAGDNSITTFDTEGTDDGVHQVDGNIQGMWGVQIQIRATDHNTGWRKSNTLYNTLSQGVYDVYVEVEETMYRIHSVTIPGDVNRIGKEPNSNRRLFTLNVIVDISNIEL